MNETVDENGTFSLWHLLWKEMELANAMIQALVVSNLYKNISPKPASEPIPHFLFCSAIT